MRKYVDNICIGLEHFIDKIGYQSSVYNSNNETIKYLVGDVSGASSIFINKYNADASILPNNCILRVIYYVWYLLCYDSKYVELYCTGRLTFIYACLAKIFARKLIVILRGTEFNGGRQLLTSNLLSLKISDVIIAKEYNLLDSIEKYSLLGKTSFLHNAIPQFDVSPEYIERDIDIIFLNTPRSSRNVLFLIDVLKKILDIKPQLNVVLAGFSVLNRKSGHIEESYQKQVLRKIEDLGLENEIDLLGFVDDSRSLLMRSKIFVFPANVVFCNYTLLEAMSVGAVPIVLNGEGADLIVDDKVNGRINNLDVDAFVESILECLNDSTWIDYSNHAQNKILTDYSINVWYEKMFNIKKACW